MNDTRPYLRLRWLAGATVLIGPAGAMLYETGRFRFFPSEPLYDLWLLTAIAALGAGVGVVSSLRGAKILGLACFLSNAAILVLYGFIATFFWFGGSR